MNRENELKVPYPILDWLVKVLHQIYSSANAKALPPSQQQQQQQKRQQTKLIFHDVVVVLQKYLNNPLKIKTKVFIHNTGESELLLCLHGAFASIPLLVYVPKNYPELPPFVMIDHEQWNRIIREQHQQQQPLQEERLLWVKQQLSHYVDSHTGFLCVTSVLNWNSTAERHLLRVVDDIVDLLNILSRRFQDHSTSTNANANVNKNPSMMSPFLAVESTSDTGLPPPIPFRPAAKSPRQQPGGTVNIVSLKTQQPEVTASFTPASKVSENGLNRSEQELFTAPKLVSNDLHPSAGPPPPPPPPLRPDRPRTSLVTGPSDTDFDLPTRAAKPNAKREEAVFSSIVPDLMDLDISSSSNETSFPSGTTNTKFLLAKTISSLGQADKKALNFQYENKLKEMEQVFIDFSKVHDYQANLIASQRTKLEQWVSSLKGIDQKVSDTTRKITKNGFPIQSEDTLYGTEKEQRLGKSPIKDWQNVCIDIAYESRYENHLLELESKNRSLDDCIYLMTKKATNTSNTETTSSSNAVFCLKKIRELARQQFMTRYEIKKLSTVIKEENNV